MPFPFYSPDALPSHPRCHHVHAAFAFRLDILAIWGNQKFSPLHADACFAMQLPVDNSKQRAETTPCRNYTLARQWPLPPATSTKMKVQAPPSSSGLGPRVLSPVTGVQIPLGVLFRRTLPRTSANHRAKPIRLLLTIRVWWVPMRVLAEMQGAQQSLSPGRHRPPASSGPRQSSGNGQAKPLRRGRETRPPVRLPGWLAGSEIALAMP